MFVTDRLIDRICLVCGRFLSSFQTRLLDGESIADAVDGKEQPRAMSKLHLET